MNSSLLTRNVRIGDRRTSVRLEPELWRALETIAELEGVTVNDLCTTVETDRGPRGGFTSALRVFIVEYFGSAIRSDGSDAPEMAEDEADAEADVTAEPGDRPGAGAAAESEASPR